MKRADLLLKPLIEGLGINEGVRFAQIQSNWNFLFQKPLSHHMCPYSLAENELMITVDSPAWLQELKFLQNEIIKKLAPYQVKSVRFRIGRVQSAANQKARRENRLRKTLTASDLSFIEETISTIEDMALKETLQKTIAKAIAAGMP